MSEKSPIRQDLSRLYSARSLSVLSHHGDGSETTYVVEVENTGPLPRQPHGQRVIEKAVVEITPTHVNKLVQDALSAIYSVRAAKKEAGLSNEAMLEAPEDKVAELRSHLAQREGVLRAAREIRNYRNRTPRLS